jgi:hypothetical protein
MYTNEDKSKRVGFVVTIGACTRSTSRRRPIGYGMLLADGSVFKQREVTRENAIDAPARGRV